METRVEKHYKEMKGFLFNCLKRDGKYAYFLSMIETKHRCSVDKYLSETPVEDWIKCLYIWDRMAGDRQYWALLDMEIICEYKHLQRCNKN